MSDGGAALTARAAWSRVLGYLGVCFVLGALAQYGGLVLFLLVRDGPGSLGTRVQIATGSGDGDALLGAAAFAAPILLAVTWWVRRTIDRGTLADLGLARRGASDLLQRGLAVGFWLPALILLLGRLAGVYRFEDPAGMPLLGFPRLGPLVSSLGCLALFIGGFLLQGGAEELLVRGYVQTSLLRWKPSGTGRAFWVIVVPSLLFAAAHLSNDSFTLLAFLNTALAGMVLATLVLRTGSLWPAIGAHAGWNLGLAVVWSLPVSGVVTSHLLAVELVPHGGLREWIFGGTYGPEGGLITTALYGAAWGLIAARIPARQSRDRIDPEGSPAGDIASTQERIDS